MGVDLRQVVAGILTMTMFVMLGHMIKRDHFDSDKGKLPGEEVDLQFDPQIRLTKKTNTNTNTNTNGPWLQDTQLLNQCWTKPSSSSLDDSKGYVILSFTNGPEYHVSQIADAVLVARYLGATLVLPDIKGTKPGDERKFEDIYNVDKFRESLEGVVKVVNDLPKGISIRKLAIVKVPNRVTEEHIKEEIEPIFKSKGNVRLTTYFPSVNMRTTTEKSVDSVSCLAMFGSLELQPDVNEVVDSMVDRLRALSRKSDGQFVAVDLRVAMLDHEGCHSNGRKSCFSAQEIAVFLRKVGFGEDTTVYVTQSRWDSSIDVLKDIFPKTYTKESIIPADKKSKYLESENSEYEKVIDFYLCSQSDVFVPAISGLFYANVAGKRIASGKTQILVPSEISGTSAPITKYISPYILKKNHMAYSCFC
ncbi:hypothetical protein ACFE04_016110 [Oxalis oulophora]